MAAAIPAALADPPAAARQLFAGIPGQYERMAALLSLGQDPRWRRFLVSRLDLQAGPRVLDVATGTTAVARLLAARGAREVVAIDQSRPMLRRGAVALDDRGVAQDVLLLQGDARALPFPAASFDAVTFTYLLRYVPDPAATLAELTRVLRPGGRIAGLEFHIPPPPWRAPWRLYTRLGLPLAGRTVSPAWRDVGRFLGPSIERFYQDFPLDDQLAAWRAAGIGDARARTLSLGGGVVIWGSKEGGWHGD